MDFTHIFSNVPISGVFSLMNGGIGSILVGGFFSALLLGIVLIIVPLCLIFKKAGRAWWEAVVPVYNLYVLTIITGQPAWYIIGFFIPVLNWITSIYLYYQLSKRFGYDVPFTIGLVFLPFIFLPILGFGGALYTAPEIIENNLADTPSQPESVEVVPPVQTV